MAWTSPKTWSSGELITAAMLNTYVRDNQTALKAPPTDTYEVNEGADYTEASTSFNAIDSTNLRLTIATTGGDVLFGWVGSISNSGAGNFTFFDIYDVDNTVYLGLDDGICVQETSAANDRDVVSFTYLLTGVAADTHNYEIHWKVSAGTTTLYAGAGTANGDVHGQFWAREI